MEKIFYANKNDYATDDALRKILVEFYQVENPVVLRSPSGKPYVENAPHFSVTHTKQRLYVAVSSQPVGLDAESLQRNGNFQTILKKFPDIEQEEIVNREAFLTHWVAKESAVKYLGGTLAKDLSKLAFLNGRLFFENHPLPVMATLLHHENHLLCVCCEKDFSNAIFVKI